MTRDPVYASELAHDTAGVDASPFMAEALTSIVESLMSGEKPRGLAWGLQDFLAEQVDLHELVAALCITRDWAALDAEIIRRLRASLEDHDAVHDLAAEMANEPEDQS